MGEQLFAYPRALNIGKTTYLGEYKFNYFVCDFVWNFEDLVKGQVGDNGEHS